MIKENRQTDEALSWGFDGRIPSKKMLPFGYFFIGPSMHSSVVIAQHKDLKMHPHTKKKEKKKR